MGQGKVIGRVSSPLLDSPDHFPLLMNPLQEYFKFSIVSTNTEAPASLMTDECFCVES
jgi:hypothetical protein